MIVVIGTKIPSRVRGVLKIWLIEPKPGVLCGNVNKIIEERIVKFISPYISSGIDMMIIRDNKQDIQGFSIYSVANTESSIACINGLQLIKKTIKYMGIGHG